MDTEGECLDREGRDRVRLLYKPSYAKYCQQRPGTDPSRERIMPQTPDVKLPVSVTRASCCLGCPHTPVQSHLLENNRKVLGMRMDGGGEESWPPLSLGDLSLRGLVGWK